MFGDYTGWHPRTLVWIGIFLSIPIFSLVAAPKNLMRSAKSSGPAPAPLPPLIPQPKPVPTGYSCSAHNLYNTEVTVNDIMEHLITSTSYALASTKAAPLTLAKRDDTGSTELYTLSITNAIDFLPAPESLTPVIITINGNIPVMHTTGQYNFFAGPYTGNWNTTSEYNTGLGYQSLPSVTSGLENTAVGYGSLYTLTTGTANTAIGAYALAQTTNSKNNTALGYNSLGEVTTGNNNTGIGNYALAGITIGNNNIALGDNAGSNLTDGNNNIYLASPGTPHDVGTLRLGNPATQTSCFIAGIKDVPLTSGNFLAIDTNGQLGTFSHADVRTALVDDKNNLCLGTLAAAGDRNVLRLGNTTTQTSCFIAGIKDVPLKSGNFLAIDTNGQLGIFSHTDVRTALVDDKNNLCLGTLAAASDSTVLRLGNTTTQTSCFIAGIKDVPLKSGNFLAIDTNGQLGIFSHTDVRTALVDDKNNLCLGTLAAASDSKVLRLGNTTTQTSCYIAGVATNRLPTGDVVGIMSNGQLGVMPTNILDAELVDEKFNICIGALPTEEENNVIKFGTPQTQTSCFIAGIYNTSMANGNSVIVNSDGQLGVLKSSERYKHEIANLEDISNIVCQLRPVSFKFNWNIDPQQIIQYGLIAEEVAKIDPNLVIYDDNHQPLAVKYHLLTALLIKALQEQDHQLSQHEQALQKERKRTDALEQAVHQLLAKTSHHTN